LGPVLLEEKGQGIGRLRIDVIWRKLVDAPEHAQGILEVPELA